MRLFDLILRGGMTPEEKRAFDEQKLHIDELGKRIGGTLGTQFKYNPIRQLAESGDGAIRIAPPNRLLFQPKKMAAVQRKKLETQGELIGDGKNMFRKEHFEKIGEALDWRCELYLSETGNAPALFKTQKAGVWLSPVIQTK